MKAHLRWGDASTTILGIREEKDIIIDHEGSPHSWKWRKGGMSVMLRRGTPWKERKRRIRHEIRGLQLSVSLKKMVEREILPPRNGDWLGSENLWFHSLSLSLSLPIELKEVNSSSRKEVHFCGGMGWWCWCEKSPPPPPPSSVLNAFNYCPLRSKGENRLEFCYYRQFGRLPNCIRNSRKVEKTVLILLWIEFFFFLGRWRGKLQLT